MAEAGLPTAQIAMRSNSRLLQAEFCRQGMGLAVLPKPLGDRIPDIVPIDLGGRHPAGHLRRVSSGPAPSVSHAGIARPRHREAGELTESAVAAGTDWQLRNLS
jgi:hypothetical protein